MKNGINIRQYLTKLQTKPLALFMAHGVYMGPAIHDDFLVFSGCTRRRYCCTILSAILRPVHTRISLRIVQVLVKSGILCQVG